LQIKNSLGETLQKKDIKWIVTIPAIWEEKSKQIMINASINAGLIDNNTDKSLFLALEPEVAGIYYYTISQEILSFKSSHIKEGKPYKDCASIVLTESGSILLAKYENNKWQQCHFTHASSDTYPSQDIYYTDIKEKVIYWTDGEAKDYSRKQNEE
jgi:hypothetical protein